jgi:hypothetical protein
MIKWQVAQNNSEVSHFNISLIKDFCILLISQFKKIDKEYHDKDASKVYKQDKVNKFRFLNVERLSI